MIANGVVVDLGVLFGEIDGLEAARRGHLLLKVSASAHVIVSYNKTLDKVAERFLGKRRIGTTGRGIGPAYADKINRIGIRIEDLFDDKILQPKVEGVLELRNQLLTKVYNRRAIGRRDRRRARVVRRPVGAERGRQRAVAQQGARRGRTVLFEGAQATMLDVDHGTYPFVTSSTRSPEGCAPARVSRRPGSTG